MPRGGARKGAGAPRGKRGPNKATIERAALAERLLEQDATRHVKLGKESLAEFRDLFAGLAAGFQPEPAIAGAALTRTDLTKWAGTSSEPMFEKYAKLACACAEKLAEYQSPKMGRVQVVAPPPDPTGPVRKRFSVGIFDGQGRPAPRHIDVKPSTAVVSQARN